METGVGLDAGAVGLEGATTLDQHRFQGVQVGEGAVGDGFVEEGPQPLGRLQFRRAGWQEDEVDAVGNRQVVGEVPAGLVEDEDGMCLRGQVARALIKVMLHRLRIGARHDHRRPRAAFGTDRTKQIGRFGTQIGECPWPGAAPRPAPGARVFLAEPHFVLKPDF